MPTARICLPLDYVAFCNPGGSSPIRPDAIGIFAVLWSPSGLNLNHAISGDTAVAAERSERSPGRQRSGGRAETSASRSPYASRPRSKPDRLKADCPTGRVKAIKIMIRAI